ncbi:MAG: hypothetical protein IPM69_00425 [Ignavibacteria bacterium]|nr:hypothetical protein [Ignavibacteria bacterium]
MTEIQHTDSEDKDKKRPWWKRILFFLGRIVRRVVVWTFLTLVIASLSIVIMSQTEGFRRWAAPHIQTLINDQLDGKIEFSDFEIDIFNGLVFHDVRVLAAGDTVLASQRITLGYDLERLFTNEIYVTNLTIETPRIKILRSLDSVWNVTKIAKPSTDTTPANPFTWKIHAYDIAIKGGTITVYDSTSELTNSNAIDFSHLHLWNFNIALSADASIDKKDFELQLHSLSFEEAKGLSLKELSCKVLLNKSRIDLSNMKYITQDTRLELQAKADSLNIFEGDVGENLKRAKLQLELNADSLNTKDIIRFLPDAGVLGTYKVAIEASGSLSKIAIKKLLVESPFSKLSATGKLLHLDNPEKLSFQANVDKSYINYDELQTNAQSLYLPKLDFLGTVRMHKASINALPSDSIAIYANATTASGKVDGFLTLFMRDTLAYRGNLFVENINLSKLAHNSTLESSINAHVDIKGQGIMLSELEAFATIESLNSTIAGKHWSKAYFSGGSHSQGIVNIDSLMIDLTEDKLEPDSLAFDPFALKSPPQIMNASGMIDLRSMKNPRYKLSGNFEHFPLAKMADMSSLPRTVTANFLLNGSGFHPDSLEGKYHFNFKELTFPDRSFMPWKLDLDISRNYLTTERLIEIRSPIVAGKIEGLFTIDDLSKECISQGEYIADFLQKKLPVLTVSSSRPTKPNTTKLKSFTHPVKPINVRFDLDILDISPVNVMLGKDLSIDTRAKLRGSIVANMNSSTTDISECTFDKSRIITGGTSIISDKLETSLKVNIQHNGSESVLQNFQFSSVCDSTLTINETYLYRPTAKLNYTNGTMALSASGVLDNEYSGNVVGAITFQDTIARFTIDSLSVGYGGMNWQSHKTASGSFTPHGIEITKFELRRKNAERIELSGLISNEKFKDLSLKLHELPMREISKFKFIDEDTKQLLKTLEGEVVDLAIGLNGTYQKPIISCTGQFDNLSYNGVTIGNQTIELKYVDSMITGTIDIVNPKVTGNPKVLQIGIEQLPLNCAFTDIAHRMSKTEPLIITGRASKLSMGIIAPFVPGISKLQGLVDAEITVEGIAPNIHYGGKAALTNANFVVQSTNIKYYADGQISLKTMR